MTQIHFFRSLMYCTLVTALLSVTAPLASAERKSLGFVQLHLPPLWSCQKDKSDWVCQPDNPSQQSEVLIFVTSKQRNPTDDTLENYKQELAIPGEPSRYDSGTEYRPEVRHVVEKKFGETVWVDSLHLGDMQPTFFTRYFASFDDRVAGLVGFLIAESAYAQYSSIIDQVMGSARIIYEQDTFVDIQKYSPPTLIGVRSKGAAIGRPSGSDAQVSPSTHNDQVIQGLDNQTLFQIVLALAGLAVVFYVLKKRRRRR